MRLEDMKNDIPETPDFIHNMIQTEVAKQLADNKVANLRRRKRWTAPKVAAVAAACALAVSTSGTSSGSAVFFTASPASILTETP